MEIRSLTIGARRLLKPSKTFKPGKTLKPTTVRKRGRSGPPRLGGGAPAWERAP
jgi:hypothetical protein